MALYIASRFHHRIGQYSDSSGPNHGGVPWPLGMGNRMVFENRLIRLVVHPVIGFIAV